MKRIKLFLIISVASFLVDGPRAVAHPARQSHSDLVFADSVNGRWTVYPRLAAPSTGFALFHLF